MPGWTTPGFSLLLTYKIWNPPSSFQQFGSNQDVEISHLQNGPRGLFLVLLCGNVWDWWWRGTRGSHCTAMCWRSVVLQHANNELKVWTRVLVQHFTQRCFSRMFMCPNEGCQSETQPVNGRQAQPEASWELPITPMTTKAVFLTWINNHSPVAALRF